MSDLFQTITNAFKDAMATDVLPLPTVLDALGDKLERLSGVSVDWMGQGVQHWLDEFKIIFGDQNLRDSLLVRALQMKAPRVAESLTILGVITYSFVDEPVIGANNVHHFNIKWDKLTRLFSNPGPTAADPGWWIGKIHTIDDVKRVQVYASMLAVSPAALIRLEYERKGFAALPSPEVADPTIDLTDLLGLVHSPLPVRLPTAILNDFLAYAAQTGLPAADPTDLFNVIGPDILPVDGQHRLNGFGIEIALQNVQNVLSKTLDLGGGWKLGIASPDAGNKTYRVFLQDGHLDHSPPQLSEGEFEIFVSKQPPSGEDAMVFGPKNGTHLSLGSARVLLQMRDSEPYFTLSLDLQRITLVLTTESLQSIGGSALPASVQWEAELRLAYEAGKGLLLHAGADGVFSALFAAPMSFTIGSSPVEIKLTQVQVKLEIKPDEIGGTFYARMHLNFGASAQLGPLHATMDAAGVMFGRWEEGNAFTVEPPAGVGLEIAAGPVSGGGFLKKYDSGEYSGAMQLKVLDGIGVTAFGLYKRLPEGDPSFVAVLGVKFPFPGIQLSWGFALEGVGGLVGINRRADTDLLRDRLSNGASGHVLFCEDPVKQAPALLNDLRAFFPEEKGIFVVGPTFKLNWLELLHLDVGVFIELPGPRKLFLTGSARMQLGADENLALVNIRLDFVGGMDFTQQLIFFQAALVNSHVMLILDITGEAALRIGYGPNGYFVFSVGGFHPSFNPGPLNIPRLTRAGASLSMDMVVSAWLKLGMYLAITPNTLQLGANVEAGLSIGPISAHGWFSFDSLIQFRPFFFEAEIDAGFDVEVADYSLCGVRVQGNMTGPGPITINARASISILFFEISESVTLEIGSGHRDTAGVDEDIVNLLKSELSKAQNLRAEGEDGSVLIRTRKAAAGGADGSILRISPVGSLIWEQKRVPLALDITRFEGVDLAGPHHLSVNLDEQPELNQQPEILCTPEKDWFGVGTFAKLGKAEQLNAPTFSELQSGLRIGAGKLDFTDTRDYTVNLDLWKLPKRFPKFACERIVLNYVGAGLLNLQRERGHYVPARATEPMVKTRQENWSSYDKQGAVHRSALNPAQAILSARTEKGGFALSELDSTIDLSEVI